MRLCDHVLRRALGILGSIGYEPSVSSDMLADYEPSVSSDPSADYIDQPYIVARYLDHGICEALSHCQVINV